MYSLLQLIHEGLFCVIIITVCHPLFCCRVLSQHVDIELAGGRYKLIFCFILFLTFFFGCGGGGFFELL